MRDAARRSGRYDGGQPSTVGSASMRLSHIRALTVVLALVVLPAVGLAWLCRSLEATPPAVPPPDLLNSFFDTTPVTVVFTVEGEKILWSTTADDIRSNLTLWRRMHLAKWNTYPNRSATRASTRCLHGIETS